MHSRCTSEVDCAIQASSGSSVLQVCRSQLKKILQKENLIYLILVTLLGIMVERTCTHLATKVFQATGFTSALNRLIGGVSLAIEPVSRCSVAHRFLFIGHTHFLTRYHVTVTNADVRSPQRPTLQFSSATGHIVSIGAPPIVKAHLADGTEAVHWTGKGHGKDPRSLALDFQLTPQGTSVTFVVVVERMDEFVPDEDLNVQLTYVDLFLQAKPKPVKWTSKIK